MSEIIGQFPQKKEPELKFTVWRAKTISDELLSKCAKLFSKNYGKWVRNKPSQKVTEKSIPFQMNKRAIW